MSEHEKAIEFLDAHYKIVEEEGLDRDGYHIAWGLVKQRISELEAELAAAQSELGKQDAEIMILKAAAKERERELIWEGWKAVLEIEADARGFIGPSCYKHQTFDDYLRTREEKQKETVKG